MIQHSLAFTSATTTRILLSNARKNSQISPPWLPFRGSFEDRRRLIDREFGLLNRESALAAAFLNVCSVVERVRHRTALLLRFRGSFRAFSLERSRLDTFDFAQCRLVSPYQISSHFFQKLVDELDGHGAFADGGGDAFDGAGADVAGGEDAGAAGLEQERLAFSASSEAIPSR